MAALFFVSSESAAQDPNVRAQAVELLEKANGISLSPQMPNVKRTDEFQVLDTSSPVREGMFTREVIQGAGRREEMAFGDFHAVDVWTPSGLKDVRTSEIRPAEVTTVMRFTPVWRVMFADDDVIRSIVDKAGEGEQKLRCIEFDTIRGQRTDNNEICVDAATGALARQKIGSQLVEYSEFFSFAGALLPGKIFYSSDGVRKLEIAQTMVELKDSADSVLGAPPNADVRPWCTTYKRAIGERMPQPKEGNSGGNVDVVIRGMIGRDGRVHQAVVQSAERPDLGAEALTLVQQWVFSPAVCDGRPSTEEATLVMHFQRR
jgi:hypothetical protein